MLAVLFNMIIQAQNVEQQRDRAMFPITMGKINKLNLESNYDLDNNPPIFAYL